MTSNSAYSLNIKIRDFIVSIKEIYQLIESYKNSNSESELREHLRGITKAISTFEQRKVSVPSEFRELKTSLINKLSEIDEINKILLELNNEIKSLLNIIELLLARGKSDSNKGEKNPKIFSNIKLTELISAGLLSPNTRIVHSSKTSNFVGTITKDGRILCLINGTNKFFDSPSGAAQALSGGSKNGWDWWYIQQDNKLVPLAKIREKFLNNYK